MQSEGEDSSPITTLQKPLSGKAETPHGKSSKREVVGKKDAVFRTIDQSFVLTKSQLQQPRSVDATHLYNGQPTQFTDLQSDEIKLDPSKTAMLRRTNFLPYDGVLYEINDAPIEQEALWTFGNRTCLTYKEYEREVKLHQNLQLQQIVVKQNITKTQDYSKSPYRPLCDFFPALVRKGIGRLKLLIPPTLVLEGTDRALYFTEEKTGYVRRFAGDNCDDSVIQKLLMPHGSDGPAPDLPTLLMKRMSDGGNDVVLITPKMLLKILRDAVDGSLTIQKYIKPRGASPSMYRTTWKRTSSPSTVLVTGQKIPMAEDSSEGTRFPMQNKEVETPNILSFRGGGAIVTQRVVADLVSFVEKGNTRCQFESFVGDFIKDEQEHWYFLQAKSFHCTSTK
eukprot:CAMPEP_0181300864 /NCGR_PEP_ID=MMETSP1101-20121128/7117_1 /TAXON_ID=46948 /ORGANISM="Rhodomonas abbreviata, Strain Caron Lab Isolate" /LENGTH=393 /DNA_ID=CAMNT_0023406129 /DNA_START=84 /DNA_END=1265 /DNA_ORIENTATION=-